MLPLIHTAVNDLVNAVHHSADQGEVMLDMSKALQNTTMQIIGTSALGYVICWVGMNNNTHSHTPHFHFHTQGAPGGFCINTKATSSASNINGITSSSSRHDQ